jgi:hypothetical protein
VYPFGAFAIERGRIELVERSVALEPLRQIRVGDEQGAEGDIVEVSHKRPSV